MKTYKIAAIPADGIGPEVIAAGLQALEVLAKRDGGFNLDVKEFDWGSDRYKKTGALMPEDGTETLKARCGACACLFVRASINTPTYARRASCQAFRPLWPM